MDWSLLFSSTRFRESNRPKDARNEFESDLGRIVFSPAVRRMHDKTQVFPLITDDNIHTRLTHSIEVQSLGYSLGISIIQNNEIKLKLNPNEDYDRIIPSIISSVALAHDIGNPPFGHFGEEIIQSYFKKKFSQYRFCLDEDQKKEFCNFDGNAQGFRVLTRLQPLQDEYGLNLTIGTLSAYLKYPVLYNEITDNGLEYQKKGGIFNSEKELLQKIREETQLIKIRNPFTFLMEAADSICYHIMDIEDGFNKKYYTFDTIYKYLETNGNETVKQYLNEFDELCKKVLTQKLNLEKARMVILRTFLFSKLIQEVKEEFISNLEKIDTGEYGKELIYNKNNCLGKILKKFEFENIFPNREIHSVELTGMSVLEGLLNHFVDGLLLDSDKGRRKRLITLISDSLKTAILFQEKMDRIENLSDYMKLHLIVDYISGMTDTFALNLYRKLEGIKIG